MKCPRCGFVQLEEDYCAQCGGHIPSLLKRKRRKHLVLCLLTGLVVATGVAGLFFWFDYNGGGPSKELFSHEERSLIPRLAPPPPAPPRPPQALKKTKSHPEAQNKIQSKEQFSPGTAVKRNEGNTPKDFDPGEQLKRWAAQEWLERAKELAGDREGETEMYRRAIEVDPSFASPHYHLGLLLWREGDLEAAKEEFKRFLDLATSEERELLLLPQGVNPEDLIKGTSSASQQ